MTRHQIDILSATLLVLVASSMKVISHPHSIDPIIALSLFSGVIVKNRKMSFILPLFSMFFSDLLLEIIYPGNGFYGSGQVGNYLSLLFITALGFGMKQINIISVIGFSLMASIGFYLLSNTNVYLADYGNYYSKDWNGYFNCMIAGIPFIKNSLINDLLFSAILFSGYVFVYKRQTAAIKSI